MVVPAGSPIWTRTASHTDYGGNVNKRNFMAQGVTNPKTDVGAEAVMRMAADLAAISRTLPFAIIDFTCNDSAPAAPTINSCLLMTGVQFASYPGATPPSGFPTAARVNTGRATITFASTYADPYGVSAAYVPRFLVGSIVGSLGGGSTVAVVNYTIAGSAISLELYAGAYISNGRASIVVF